MSRGRWGGFNPFWLVLALAGVISSVLVATTSSNVGAAGGVGGGPLPNVDWSTLESEPIQQWGVVGLGNTINDPKPQVWDIAEIGDRIFVAGAFTGVQRNGFDPSSLVEPQPYLAAFDRDSGDWISTFTPAFDRAIYALEVSPDGSLLVGGEFTTVNGAALGSLVSLNPTTGAVNSTFAAKITRISGSPMVRELVIEGGNLYAVGTFNHHAFNNGGPRYVYQTVRMNANTGQMDTNWLPRPTGSGVWDVLPDAGRGRVHLVGYFSSVDAQPNTANMVTVDHTTGAVITNLTAFTPNDPFQTWTRALGQANDNLYVGGAEHVVQVLDSDTRTREGYQTTGVGCGNFSPRTCPSPVYIGGGDFQVIEVAGNAVLAGCHCFGPRSSFVNSYATRTHFSSYDGQFTRRDFAIAYNPATNLPYSWVPGLRQAFWGTWALFVDSRGCAYVGGDYTRTGAGRWLGGFSRHCNPVTAPGSLGATSANGSASLSWTAPAGQLPTEKYRVSRDATLIGETTGTTYTDSGATAGATHIYTVETVDVSGRRSPAAPVSVLISGADTQPPTQPAGITAVPSGSSVALSWSASTDNVGVRGYLIHRNFQYVAFVTSGTTFTDTGVGNGSQLYQVRAQDVAGNNSTAGQVTVSVGAPDTQPPTVPQNVTARADGSTVTVTWSPSTDNVAVKGYLVHRNFQYVAFVAAGTTFVQTNVPAGSSTYQIRAQDTSNNNSAPAPVIVSV